MSRQSAASARIGSLPAFAAAPLEYRYALDAAAPVVGRARAPLVRCGVPQLVCEVRQRVPHWDDGHDAPAGLWVEPLGGTADEDLEYFASRLAAGAPLVVIASRRLARYLPECRGWHRDAIGHQPRGVGKLRRALVRSGFAPGTTYGIHSPLAIALNAVSQLMERCRRPDVADRLHFAGRLRYCVTGPLATLSTVALLIATRRHGRS